MTVANDVDDLLKYLKTICKDLHDEMWKMNVNEVRSYKYLYASELITII